MNMRNPFCIEFTGTPNSGKTTLISILASSLMDAGYKVEVKREDAEIVPTCIPKKTYERNLWITNGQLQSLIEAKHSLADVVIFDRGFFDAKFWANLLVVQNVCSKNESKIITDFLDSLDELYKFQPDYLFYIDVSAETSVKRRQLTYSVDKGSIIFSNNNFISFYQNEFNKFYESLDVPKFYLDTSNLTLSQAEKIIVQTVNEILT